MKRKMAAHEYSGVEVNLCRQSVVLTANQFSTLMRAVSKEERGRIDNLHRPQDACNTLIGHLIVRQRICERTHLRNRDLSFTTNEHGKPLASIDPSVHFNVSHTDGYIAVAIGDKPVGIDFEAIKPVDLAIVGGYLASDEKRYIMSRSPNLRLRAFYEIWTKKEAYLKWDGRGLSMPLSAFSVLEHQSEVYFRRVLDNNVAICHVCTTQQERPKSRVVSIGDTGLDIIGPGLALLDGLKLKGAVAVTRYADLTLSPFALNSFPAVTVAAVAAVVSLGTMLFIAEVLINSRAERLCKVGHFGISSITGKCVLHEVVGANTEEIAFWGKDVGVDRSRRYFDHHPHLKAIRNPYSRGFEISFNDGKFRLCLSKLTQAPYHWENDA